MNTKDFHELQAEARADAQRYQDADAMFGEGVHRVPECVRGFWIAQNGRRFEVENFWGQVQAEFPTYEEAHHYAETESHSRG